MARIFLSVAGEGRGHATRARTLLDHLSREHELMVFAPGLAHELLKPLEQTHGIPVVRIDGLLNHYDSKGRWEYLPSLLEWVRFAKNSPQQIARLQEILYRELPDLVLTDFEPLLPRAAERCNIPYLSIDHQHYMAAGDLSCLPTRLRLYGYGMSLGVRNVYRSQLATIISSFFEVPLQPSASPLHQVGVFLRHSVVEAQTTNLGHLVVYIRRRTPPHVLDALKTTDRPVLVYGLGPRPTERNLQFRASDEASFVRDLASSHALFCTAGNQIVGEALYLGKPLLVFPEANNHEQEINAHFVEQMRLGWVTDIASIRAELLRDFLERGGDRVLPPARRHRLNGAPHTVELIRHYLEADAATAVAAEE